MSQLFEEMQKKYTGNIVKMLDGSVEYISEISSSAVFFRNISSQPLSTTQFKTISVDDCFYVNLKKEKLAVFVCKNAARVSDKSVSPKTYTIRRHYKNGLLIHKGQYTDVFSQIEYIPESFWDTWSSVAISSDICLMKKEPEETPFKPVEKDFWTIFYRGLRIGSCQPNFSNVILETSYAKFGSIFSRAGDFSHR